MKILLLHTWLGNIGNRFVQKGAKAVAKSAFPEADILEVDGYPEYRSSLFQLKLGETRKRQLRQIVENNQADRKNAQKNVLNLLDLVDGDVAILPGCTLYEPALQDYRKTLQMLDDRDIPVVFLGAGGGDYQPATQEYVNGVFEETPPAALITRDKDAYEAYADQVQFAHDGIDCAFFIDQYYEPPRADREFVAATFDKSEEPDIGTEAFTVRPSHNHPSYGSFGLQHHFEKTNAFISDNPKEYLFIYANATETHADRVHACVPALVYGNEARLYLDSPRSALFRDIVEGDLEKERTTIDRKRLTEQKDAQIKTFRETVEGLVR